jgi:hypothetical protein
MEEVAGTSEGARRASGEVSATRHERRAEESIPYEGSSGGDRVRGVTADQISAASPGAPYSPLRLESPGWELRLGEVDRGAHPVGSRAVSASTGVMGATVGRGEKKEER